jgi:hypothetical protein
MSAIDLMLELAGVPSETIAEVEKVAPDTAVLLKLLNDNQILITKIGALITEAQPLVTQALPLINKAAAEIKIIIPAAQDVLAFIQKQQAAAAAPSPYSAPDSF